MLLRGEQVIIDQDLVTPEEMERVGPYAESLIPNGLRWFAAIGFWSGPALWGLTTSAPINRDLSITTTSLSLPSCRND